jgi:SH3-like domain-containing protein
MTWSFNRNNALAAGAGTVMVIWLGAWMWMLATRGPASTGGGADASADVKPADTSASAGQPAAPSTPVPSVPVSPPVALAPDVPDLPETAPIAKAQPKAAPAFPFTGPVKADDVYTRSGPGLNYYPTGKVHANQSVFVLAEKAGWMEIKPPAGQFSWIDRAYIQADAENPSKGTIVGTNVRVRAGSLVFAAARDVVQMKINKGAAVEILGESDGFAKVRPPEGATVWISAEFVARPGPASRPAEIAGDPTRPADATVRLVEAAPADAAPTPLLDIVYKSMTDELAKPVAEQNLDDVIDQFSKLRGFSPDENVRQYCDYYIGDLQRRKQARAARAAAEQIGRSFAEDVKKAREEIVKQTRVEPVPRPAAVEVAAAGLDEFVGYVMTARYWEAYRGSWQGGMRFRLTRGLPPEDAYVVWVQGDGVDLGKFVNRKVTLRGTVSYLPDHRSRLLMVKEVIEAGASAAAVKAAPKAAEKPAEPPAAVPASGKAPEPEPIPETP